MLPICLSLCHNPVMCSNEWNFPMWFCCMHLFIQVMNLLTFSKTLKSFFLVFRGRLSQLPSHIPLWLRHEWVWHQAQSHHSLYRCHVLPGFGQGPQEGVEGSYHRSHSANGWQQLQKWLSHTSYKLCNRHRRVEPRQSVATGIAAFQWFWIFVWFIS